MKRTFHQDILGILHGIIFLKFTRAKLDLSYMIYAKSENYDRRNKNRGKMIYTFL